MRAIGPVFSRLVRKNNVAPASATASVLASIRLSRFRALINSHQLSGASSRRLTRGEAILNNT
jgi:hypothetical protein